MNEGKKRLKQGKIDMKVTLTVASQIQMLKASKSTMNLLTTELKQKQEIKKTDEQMSNL